jgi:hypothetical protein
MPAKTTPGAAIMGIVLEILRGLFAMWIVFGIVFFLVGLAQIAEVQHPEWDLAFGFMIYIVLPVVGFWISTRIKRRSTRVRGGP